MKNSQSTAKSYDNIHKATVFSQNFNEFQQSSHKKHEKIQTEEVFVKKSIEFFEIQLIFQKNAVFTQKTRNFRRR